MKGKDSEFYNALYKGDANLSALREQKLISPAKRTKREIVKKELDILPINSHVLEIGCGVGDIIGMLKFSKKKGMDISKNAIEKAKGMFPSCNFSVEDASKKLRVKSGKFDAVIEADVIEHLKKDETLIAESARILRKGGLLVLFTPYSGKYEDVPIPNNMQRQVLGVGGDLRDYGRNLLKRLEAKGFVIRKARYIGGPLSKFIWKAKEKIIGKRKRKIEEQIMTGTFMNKSRTSVLLKKFLSALLFRIYMLDYYLFSNRNKKGILLIVASKK
jgi:2-polyprenyl-3-methyl-5-hydroxy-6-metoxy-1,4-benzoquinol methylase